MCKQKGEIVVNKIALFQLSIAMTIFGSIGYFSTFTGLPAIELVWIRCICAAIFLIMAWIVSGRFKREGWNRKDLIYIACCGVTNVCNWVFLFKAFERTSITIAITLYHLAPIIVLVMGSLFFKEKKTKLMYVSMLVCFIGTLNIIGIDGVRFASESWKGIVYSIIAACFYAATMLLGKSITTTSVYATTFIQMLIGLIVLLPFIHFNNYTEIDTSQWMYVTVTGVIHTGIVYLLFFNSIRHLSTTVVSSMVFVDPAVAIVLDVFFGNVYLRWAQLFGILCIFIGLFYSLKASSHIASIPEENYITQTEKVRRQ